MVSSRFWIMPKYSFPPYVSNVKNGYLFNMSLTYNFLCRMSQLYLAYRKVWTDKYYIKTISCKQQLDIFIRIKVKQSFRL